MNLKENLKTQTQVILNYPTQSQYGYLDKHIIFYLNEKNATELCVIV